MLGHPGHSGYSKLPQIQYWKTREHLWQGFQISDFLFPQCVCLALDLWREESTAWHFPQLEHKWTPIITNLRRNADVITNSIYRVAWIWCEEINGWKLSWRFHMTSLLIVAFIEWESRTFFLFEDTLLFIAKTKWNKKLGDRAYYLLLIVFHLIFWSSISLDSSLDKESCDQLSSSPPCWLMTPDLVCVFSERQIYTWIPPTLLVADSSW